jgi:hypothetical protein
MNGDHTEFYGITASVKTEFPSVKSIQSSFIFLDMKNIKFIGILR